MNEQVLTKDELVRRRNLVFDFFTKPERLHQSNPPHAQILISEGEDIRSYYVMEGYTDHCIYLDIREMFRKFRQDEQFRLSEPILAELQRVGIDIARFCLSSRYDLAIDLSGLNEENFRIVFNSLRCLGYKSIKVMFDVENNPYIDVDPDDFGDFLPQKIWEKQHTDWIYNAALAVITGE